MAITGKNNKFKWLMALVAVVLVAAIAGGVILLVNALAPKAYAFTPREWRDASGDYEPTTDYLNYVAFSTDVNYDKTESSGKKLESVWAFIVDVPAKNGAAGTAKFRASTYDALYATGNAAYLNNDTTVTEVSGRWVCIGYSKNDSTNVVNTKPYLCVTITGAVTVGEIALVMTVVENGVVTGREVSKLAVVSAGWVKATNRECALENSEDRSADAAMQKAVGALIDDAKSFDVSRITGSASEGYTYGV